MTDTGRVWLVCLVGGKNFPNLSVLGVYTSDKEMLSAVLALPRENHYNLYEAPVNKFLGYRHKSGQLLDGMGRLRHEHLFPPDQAEREGIHSGWESIEKWAAAGRVP